MGEGYHRNEPLRKSFDELLAILKGEGIDVPLSANALVVIKNGHFHNICFEKKTKDKRARDLIYVRLPYQ